MRKRTPKAWFAPKRYGYGAGLPIAWQGWAMLTIFLVVVIVAPLALPPLIGILIATAAIPVFGFICALTTKGGWRWRNGSS